MKFLVSSIFLIILLTGCSTKKDNSFVQSIFQTNGAAVVREHTDFLTDSLLKYQLKLNKRNPNHHSKKTTQLIIHDIKNETNTITLAYFRNKSKRSYKDYLNRAFDENYVKNRNDYLILGIYKMLYMSYTINRNHTITTLQYDIGNIKEANKIMQIVQYRIQTAKDKDGNYLFLTWQRAWQIELLKKMNENKKIDFKNYTKQELLYHSNMSFQVISSKMVFTLQETLRYLGEEGANLSIQTMKNILFFI